MHRYWGIECYFTFLPATASRYRGIVTPLCIFRRKDRYHFWTGSLDCTHLCRMGMLVCGDLCYSLCKLYQSFRTIFFALCWCCHFSEKKKKKAIVSDRIGNFFIFFFWNRQDRKFKPQHLWNIIWHVS